MFVKRVGKSAKTKTFGLFSGEGFGVEKIIVVSPYMKSHRQRMREREGESREEKVSR